MPDSSSAKVAYFSMEIGLGPLLPTYSGGLGALAGDSLRSAADLGRAYGRSDPGTPKGLFPAEA
jgi:glucan phosphorylase